MAGKGIPAGRAVVKLFADDSELIRGLRRAQKRLRSWGASIAKVGAGLAGFGAGVIGSLVKITTSFASTGDQLHKMSARTGVAVESLSALSFAAQQSGSSLETVEKGIKTMQRSLLDADLGLSTANDALDRLGVTSEQLRKMSPEEQFLTLAEAVAGVEDPSDKAALAMKFLGRAGQELVPLLSGGRKGIEQLMAEAKSLGIVISTDQANAAAAFTDAWNRVTQQLKIILVQIGSALAPMLTTLATRAKSVIKTVIDWVKKNSGLVVTVFKVAAAITAAGAALVGIGAALGLTGMSIGGFASLLTIAGTVLGAILSPIGLVVAALAGLGAAFFIMTDVGGQALGWLGERFSSLKAVVLEVFGGIADALMAGDIAKAGEILWAGLNLLFQEGVNKLTGVWVGFKTQFLAIAGDMAKGLMNVFGVSTSDIVGAWSTLEKTWVEVTSFMEAAWATFLSSFRKGWGNTQNFLAKGIVSIMGMFDDSIDVEDAQNILDQQNSARNRGIDAQRDRQLMGVEQRRQQRLAAVAGSRGSKTDAINNLLSGGGDFSGQLAASQRRVDQARSQLNKLLADSGDKSGSASETAGKADKKLQQAAFKLLDGSEAGPGGKGSAKSIGSFSARAIGGFAAGGFEQKTSKNTAAAVEQLKLLNKTAKKAKGPVFA